MKIQEIIFRHQDEKYGDFLAKLVPTLPREKFIGIRSPEYKKIIKEIQAECPDEVESFMTSLPHQYNGENILQVCLINQIKDYQTAVSTLEAFLPYADNWAVTDGLGPKCFEKNKAELIKKIRIWIDDEKPYTKRVAMLFLKKYYLKEAFNPQYLEWAAAIRSDEYYVNMMTAWLFADALVYQWDTAVEFIKSRKMDTWTHNKAIQKAVESFRITDDQKSYLRSLKIKK